MELFIQLLEKIYFKGYRCLGLIKSINFREVGRLGSHH